MMTRSEIQTELEYRDEIADRLSRLSAIIDDADLQRELAETLARIQYLFGLLKVVIITGRERI